MYTNNNHYITLIKQLWLLHTNTLYCIVFVYVFVATSTTSSSLTQFIHRNNASLTSTSRMFTTQLSSSPGRPSMTQQHNNIKVNYSILGINSLPSLTQTSNSNSISTLTPINNNTVECLTARVAGDTETLEVVASEGMYYRPYVYDCA